MSTFVDMFVSTEAAVEVREADLGDITIVSVAEDGGFKLFVRGADRADFLRRLAAECTRAADELDGPAVSEDSA